MKKFKTALVALLVSVAAIGCSELSEDQIVTDDSVAYETPAPVDPTPVTPPTIEPAVEIAYDLTYVCLQEGHEMDYASTDGKYNVYEPMTMNLLHAGVLGNPSHIQRLVGGEMFCPIIDPMPVVCEADEYMNNSTGKCDAIPTIFPMPPVE